MIRTQDGLYPALEPYRAAWLAVDGGHEIFFEESGCADGVPIVFLHGGPGSGCTPAQRRFFDPAFYRVVLFDQRSCGRSRPAGRLETNTTADLVADIERLRDHLGIERWVVFGGSWGSTLALAYARAFPRRVRALVLRGVFLGRKSEVEAFAYGLRGFLPEAWAELAGRFRIHDEHQARNEDLAQRCAETILTGSPDEARAVAAAWSRLESEAMAMTAPGSTSSASTDPLSTRMRVYMHYLANRYFLRDGELLEGLDALRDIPTDIVQGRLDPVCPPVTAWELAQRLPQARLVWVAGAGHGAFEPALSRALVSATDALRERLR
ncbi:MAG: prolyl aminopeptidase [Panacagrimonas sp.]